MTAGGSGRGPRFRPPFLSGGAVKSAGATKAVNAPSQIFQVCLRVQVVRQNPHHVRHCSLDHFIDFCPMIPSPYLLVVGTHDAIVWPAKNNLYRGSPSGHKSRSTEHPVASKVCDSLTAEPSSPPRIPLIPEHLEKSDRLRWISAAISEEATSLRTLWRSLDLLPITQLGHTTTLQEGGTRPRSYRAGHFGRVGQSAPFAQV